MHVTKRLDSDFFASEDVVGHARALLGKRLCTHVNGEYTSGIIVETEAYRGPDDQACHAYGYRRTPRTEDLYKDPGTGYIYICYGIHHLFNVVTAPADVPHAVLIRAVAPDEGIATMLERRGIAKAEYRLTSGPGSLARALGIHSSATGLDLSHPDSPIWIEDVGTAPAPEDIASGIRVGVESAGESAKWPWRFAIRGNPWVSRPKL